MAKEHHLKGSLLYAVPSPGSLVGRYEYFFADPFYSDSLDEALRKAEAHAVKICSVAELAFFEALSGDLDGYFATRTLAIYGNQLGEGDVPSIALLDNTSHPLLDPTVEELAEYRKQFAQEGAKIPLENEHVQTALRDAGGKKRILPVPWEQVVRIPLDEAFVENRYVYALFGVGSSEQIYRGLRGTEQTHEEKTDGYSALELIFNLPEQVRELGEDTVLVTALRVGSNLNHSVLEIDLMNSDSRREHIQMRATKHPQYFVSGGKW